MKYIGRQVNVGFGVEDTRGTAAPITQWQPKTDLSFDETVETIQDESSIGVIVNARDSFVTKKWAEGEISGNIEVNSIGYLLLATLGEVTSIVDTTGAYKHTFELANSNQTQSLTVGIDDPVIGDKSYSLAMVESFTITAEEGQFATFTVNLKAKPGETATHSVSYEIDHKLLARYSIFKVAENLAGLSAANNVCLRSFEITFTKTLEDDYCLGSMTPIDFINTVFSIEGSFTAVFSDTTFRTYTLDGTQKAIRFELKSDETIGLSSKPRLTIDLPLVAFTEFSRSQGNDETVIQTLTFKGLYSNTDSSAVNVELVNTKSEYLTNS